MHRSTPVATYLRAFSSGGARSIVDKIDDAKLMQEMAGNFMKGETRSKVEAPQNYGFTSVVMPADRDAAGKIIAAAEAIINFIGGSRSFPVAAVMDDRRFRLKGLKPGDVGMFDHLQQQFHFTGAGAFLTGLAGKVIRLQLAEPDKQQEQKSSGAAAPKQQAGTPANGGGGERTQGQPGGGKYQGQKARFEKESKQYYEIGPNKTEHMNREQHLKLDDGETWVIMKEKKIYLGGDPDKHKFALVVTTDGPSKNVYARLP